jgi:hypothetical protein
LTNGTDEGTRPNAHDQVDTSPTSPDLARTLLRVAWLAIALGLAMEALLLLLGSSFGVLLGVKSVVADLAKNLSWSLVSLQRTSRRDGRLPGPRRRWV